MAVLALASILLTPAAAAVCHVHPPAADEPVPRLLGPYADAVICERERRLRFGAAGRCHCTAAFTPNWLGPQALDRPARAGDDRPPSGAAPQSPLP